MTFDSSSPLAARLAAAARRYDSTPVDVKTCTRCGSSPHTGTWERLCAACELIVADIRAGTVR